MTDESPDDERHDDRAKPSRLSGKGARSQPLNGKKAKLARQKLVLDADTVFGGALLEDVRLARAQNPPKLSKTQLAEKYRFDILQVKQQFPDMTIPEIIKYLTVRDPKASGAQFSRNVSTTVKTLVTAMRSPTTSMRDDIGNATLPTETTTLPGKRSPGAGVASEPMLMPPRPRNAGVATTDDDATELFSPHSPGTR